VSRARAPGRRRRRLRWTIAILIVAGLAGGAFGVWLYRASRPELYRPGEDSADITRTLSRDLPAGAPEPRLTDVTVEAGLGAFRTFAGARSSQLPEDMGPGAAWGDYDNDGDEDLFLVAAGGALDAPPSARAPSRLYENLGDGTFRVDDGFPETRIVGMGAAWGDYDGDGWLDLVVTGYRSLLLFHNDRGRLAPDPRLPAPDGFWAGPVWGDYDNDRDLDLYVCGYVQYREDEADRARASRQYGRSVPYTLNPASYSPERNLLFRNRGDGTFEEVAETLGVSNPEGRSLGALWHDLDDDGRLDLYVANDISDNALFLNRGDTFEEVSHAAFVADYRGAMGLAAADADRDGDDDLFITHWVAQENALYGSLLADGGPPLRFVDLADQKGLGQIAIRRVGWGAEFVDLEADGWPDLVVANGSTFEGGGAVKRLEPQEPFLFWNEGGRYFHDLAPLNETLAVPRVGRGLAVADYDRDGDLDVLLVTHDEGVVLLRNDMQRGHWLMLKLRSRLGPTGPPLGGGDGTTVIARPPDGAVLRRTVGGASYLSQSSRVLHLGLGANERIEALEVRWLGGDAQSVDGLEPDAAWEIVEGEAQPRRLYGAAAAPLSGRERLAEFWRLQRAAMDAMKLHGDEDRAIALLRQALALDPRHEDSLYYLANLLAERGDIEGALARLETLVEINPMSHRAHKRIGLLRARSAQSPADLAAAAAALERALSINPEETGVLEALGEVALLQGDQALAEQRLAWVCRSNPKASRALWLRGYLAWRNGDAERAHELIVQARSTRGDERKPEGSTAEGDVRRRMHRDDTPLMDCWEAWNGATDDPAVAFSGLEERLRSR